MTIEEASARLKAFALMLKYGHDLFAAKDFDSAAVLVVNNARGVLGFQTSSLYEVVGGKAHVIAQYAQPTVNAHAAKTLEDGDAVERWLKDGEPADEGGRMFVRLPLPENTAGVGFVFVWLLEYEGTVPAFVAPTVKLLSTSAGEALCYQRLCKGRGWTWRRKLPKRIFWLAVLAAMAGLMSVRVRESVTAEFSLVAPEVTRAYAWFDGSVAHCLRNDGDVVTNGEIVVEYDTSQLEYRLQSERSKLAEIEARLALARQNGFLDSEELGRAKLLEAQRDVVKVGVDEAKWYIAHARVPARADGTLVLAEGHAELLENKAVRTGDELFEVMGGKGMLAEIPVSERDASVLKDDISVELFLYTAPEKALPAEVVETGSYPILTDQKTYAYRVRARLVQDEGSLRYGMRGVAKISGGRVCLGYRLFKSLVLYLRGF